MTTEAAAQRVVRACERTDHPPMTGVDHTPLLGTWRNFDVNSEGIYQVVLTERDGSLFVSVYGADQPEPHNWGEVPATAFSDGVSNTGAVAFWAEYDLGFEKVTLVGYVNRQLMNIEPGTVFTDGSGRSPYFTRAHLYPRDE